MPPPYIVRYGVQVITSRRTGSLTVYYVTCMIYLYVKRVKLNCSDDYYIGWLIKARKIRTRHAAGLK